MDREVAKVFINVDRGFTRYIKENSLRAQSRYTIRMYMLISSWKEKVVSLFMWIDFGNFKLEG